MKTPFHNKGHTAVHRSSRLFQQGVLEQARVHSQETTTSHLTYKLTHNGPGAEVQNIKL